jgi:DNA-binding NtrC family response regulator
MQMVSSIAIVTRSEKMRGILSRVDTIAHSDTSVLLIGETGVGKELFADYIHRVSPRSDRPFVKVALSAMPHDLLESELFGHEKGAFTSASSEKKGLFELAHTARSSRRHRRRRRGPDQALRVLESQQVMRVGGTTTIPVDVRVITASKVDLKDLVGRNLFRADLFYGINVFPVEIRHSETVARTCPARRPLPAPVRSFKQLTDVRRHRALVNYDWRATCGLRNLAQRCAVCRRGDSPADLPPEVLADQPADLLVRACTRCLVDQSLSYNQVIACLETNLLRQAIQDAEGNRSQAAKALGLSLSTLRDKLKKYGLENGSD